MTNPELLTIPQAATMLDMQATTLRYYVKKGYVSSQRVGSLRCIPLADLPAIRQMVNPAGTMSRSQVADLLGIKVSTVQTLIRMGRLSTLTTPGKHVKIYRDSVERYAIERGSR